MFDGTIENLVEMLPFGKLKVDWTDETSSVSKNYPKTKQSSIKLTPMRASSLKKKILVIWLQ